MTKLADMLGHVMMGIKIPKKENDAALRTWAEVEYKKDKQYAYEMLMSGKMPDLR